MVFPSRRTKDSVIAPRANETKSYLRFQFPRTGGQLPLSYYLPFFSNPIIEESQDAVYTRNRPLSRAGNFYVYLGSESRKLKLSFFISLPHIQAEKRALNKYSAWAKTSIQSLEAQRKRFFTKSTGFTVREDGPLPATAQIEQAWLHTRRHYIETLNQTRFSDFQENRIKGKADVNTIDIVTWWINLIRTSVRNNATNTIETVPIVRLTHGIMYNDIPCVCTDYKISHDESAGYELHTFLPRKIEVSMNLEEVRMGDFSKFSPGERVKGDNLAGWESLIEHGTMDPYVELVEVLNGFI